MVTRSPLGMRTEVEVEMAALRPGSEGLLMTDLCQQFRAQRTRYRPGRAYLRVSRSACACGCMCSWCSCGMVSGGGPEQATKKRKSPLAKPRSMLHEDRGPAPPSRAPVHRRQRLQRLHGDR